MKTSTPWKIKLVRYPYSQSRIVVANLKTVLKNEWIKLNTTNRC